MPQAVAAPKNGVNAMKQVIVKVNQDHLERLTAARRPIEAIAELVWNSLDADATRVEITTRENALGGLDEVCIDDNGLGMAFDEAVVSFENLGGSPKRQRQRTPRLNRNLHGKKGRGRFVAFSIGSQVEWTTTFHANGRLARFTITGERSTLGKFALSDSHVVTANASGTRVSITGIDKAYPSLQTQTALPELAEIFCLYLKQYPGIEIRFCGSLLDPDSLQAHLANYSLPAIVDQHGTAHQIALTVIEWKRKTERFLHLCDENGFSLDDTTPGIQAPGFDFTAYVRSSLIRKLSDENTLALGMLQPDLAKLLDLTKGKLREHFRHRAAAQAANLVEEWKQQGVYPYKTEPTNVLEQIERQVFNVLALNVNEYLPDFQQNDAKSKKFALRLLKQGLEQSPAELQKIVQEVLDLPEEKWKELASLLERTTLAAIINASRLIADRLEFLRGLELLIFDAASKNVLKERSQLHRLLAENTWIFGEEFALSVDDESLTQVLQKHLQLLGRQVLSADPVLTADGTVGIVDLMLSRRIPMPKAEEREHLVIELKRPSQRVDASVADQVEKYALAVARDERFRDTKTTWTFWAISNEIDEHVQMRARQMNRPEGIIVQNAEPRITIWVRTWGQIIDACRARLNFYQKHLEYSADHDSALAHLRTIYGKYLPYSLKEKNDGKPASE
jgi:hypothetical protein